MSPDCAYCGHPGCDHARSGLHPCDVMGCECLHFVDPRDPVPATTADDGWRDAPTEPGWYWRLYGPDSDGHSDMYPIKVHDVRDVTQPGYRWLPIPTPPAPPKPLPKSRSVELTAKVTYGGTCWTAWVYYSNMEHAVTCYTPGTGPQNARKDAIQWVRDTDQLEPEIVGAP
jgi:hypothetical protein